MIVPSVDTELAVLTIPRQLRDRGRNAVSPAKRRRQSRRSRAPPTMTEPFPDTPLAYVANEVSRGITQKDHAVALGPVKGTLVIDVSYDHGTIR